MTECCCKRHERVNGSPVCPLCVVHGSDPKTRLDPSTLRAMADRWEDGPIVSLSGNIDYDVSTLLHAVATAMEGAGEP